MRVLRYESWGEGTFSRVADVAGGQWLSTWLSVAAAVGCFGTFNSLICAEALAIKYAVN